MLRTYEKVAPMLTISEVDELRMKRDRRIEEVEGRMKTDLQRRDEEVVKLEEDMKRKEERWEKEKVEISTLVRKAIEKITEALANNNHR